MENLQEVSLLTSRDEMIWSQNPSVDNPRGRQPRHNVICEQAGLIFQVAEQAVTHSGSLECFIESAILEIIMKSRFRRR